MVYYILIEKDIYECRNVPVKFSYALLVYLCLSSREILFFPFLFLFLNKLEEFDFYLMSRYCLGTTLQSPCWYSRQLERERGAYWPHKTAQNRSILFWFKKNSLSVETSQLSFLMTFWFICAFHPEISSFFPLFIPIFEQIGIIWFNFKSRLYLGTTLLNPWWYLWQLDREGSLLAA